MSEASPLQNITAVVLAGGLGTRIQSLYPDVPKPMIPVHGKPFLEWVLRYLLKQGIRGAIVSSGHLAHVVEKYFASNPISGMSVQCIAEPTPLGTGGGFLHAVSAGKRQSEGWLVLNGDSLVLADLNIAAAVFSKDNVESVVLGIEVPDTARYGKLRFDCTGQLLHFGEKEPGRGIVNAGVYLFKQGVLGHFPPQRPLSFEKDVFPALLLRQTGIQICVASGPFIDIGTPETVQQADAFIAQNLNALQTA